MNTPPAPLSLKARALRYLAMREHSRLELARKLARGEEPEQAIEKLLDELAERGLLSEDRYVESLIHRRAAGRGLSRLRQELLSQGIDPHSARDALAPLQASELERARALWSRRFGNHAADAKERARQARFLLSRGFESAVVRQVLRGSSEDCD